ncbi:hypothetical protein PCANC_14620 [Puccinia coronata f. sp. avenae]|uniref:Uncharacterized protein n=1 Tax=Puccinia coronata f. sp. avenae TaxID=200324 RepID=A0A2N5SV44_9BASI|nr:hypothetical protein PCANC_14620 [Puccinia coronata f. sp. avenae]
MIITGHQDPDSTCASPNDRYWLSGETTTTGEPGRPRETVTSSVPGAIGRANSDHPIGLRPLRNDARTRDPQKAHTSSLSRAEAATDRASRGDTYELAREPG